MSGLAAWLADLEARHLAELGFGQVRRGIQALSALYVERRGGPGPGRALDGAAKRAAFALYFGPLHFLVVRRVIRELGAAEPAPSRILDLGCGTGAAGAAWAGEAAGSPAIVGLDRHPWAVEEARRTYRSAGLRGRAILADASGPLRIRRGDAVVAAWTMNELDPAGRGALLRRLLADAGRLGGILVVEPIARGVAPWWPEWSRAFAARGGRADEWRFEEELPEIVRRLDRAAGLDHATLTARTLWLPGFATPPEPRLYSRPHPDTALRRGRST